MFASDIIIQVIRTQRHRGRHVDSICVQFVLSALEGATWTRSVQRSSMSTRRKSTAGIEPTADHKSHHR